MGSFTKKSNTHNKRAKITRRKRRSSRTKYKRAKITRKKRRSSRTKYKRPRYKKIGGEISTESMSKTIVNSFPIMDQFPSCGTCMTAIDNSMSKNMSNLERNIKLNTNVDSQTQDNWDGWTSDELDELGVPNSPSTSKMIPSEDSSNFKSPVKKPVNPYGRKRN